MGFKPSLFPQRADAGARMPLATRGLTTFRHLIERHARGVVSTAILLVFGVSYLVAFLLRFDFTLPSRYAEFFRGTAALVVLAKLAAFYSLGVFRIGWAYISLRDCLRVLRATALASGAIAAANIIFLPGMLVPRSIFLMDGTLTFLGTCGLLGLLRVAREGLRPGAAAEPREPVFIVGAGDAGDMLMREFERQAGRGLRVVAFVDDDAAKIGRSHRGVPVLGPIRGIGGFARHHGVGRVFVAMPSIAGSRMREVVSAITASGLALKVLPPLNALSSAATYAPKLRDVSIEDLLRREPVRLDTAGISAFLREKTVLVTGAAGSIGSELCRQVLTFAPGRLVVVDCAESPLHDLTLEFPERVRSRTVVSELLDITNPAAVRRLFADHHPQIVFHAAAVKHVPMLEAHPDRAIEVNVLGTRTLASAARGVSSAFVMISTDKAVKPSSVMGASKRIAERVVRGLAADPSGTRFVSVRFGNVLGSSGSVVPIFKRQIAQGGPVTVTHPDMRRYFMTIPEAVQLVLQAGALGEGGEVFVLDMGQEVRIVDLAEDLIRLSGLRPGRDVAIEFSGIRPGEKLYEEWAISSETLMPTAHPQIHRLRSPDSGILEEALRALIEVAGRRGPRADIVNALRNVVPDFEPFLPAPASAGCPDLATVTREASSARTPTGS